MISVDHNEAILFRLLADFFGKDRVIPQMSVRAVCGGSLPENLSEDLSDEIVGTCRESLSQWGKSSKCLFTIVDGHDDPKMVVELAEVGAEIVDVQRVLRRRFNKAVVAAAGVNYVLITRDELFEIAHPESTFTLSHLLQERFGILEATPDGRESP